MLIIYHSTTDQRSLGDGDVIKCDVKSLEKKSHAPSSKTFLHISSTISHILSLTQ